MHRPAVAKNRTSAFEWEPALRDFLFWKKAQGVSSRTTDDYQLWVSIFFRRYPDACAHLERRVLEHMAEPVAPATYNLRLEYLRAFLSWCVQRGIIDSNPLATLKSRRVEDRIVNLGPDVLRKLIRLPDRTTYAGLRDYALILLTLDTGIRPGEAFALRIEDFSLRGLEVRIRSEIAKTRVTRTLPLTPMTVTAVSDLIRVRPKEWAAHSFVFSTVEGQQLKRFAWERRLAKYGGKLGTKIRPYDLRHCFALEYLRNGGNAFALQRTMGHTDISMTKRYVALTNEDLRQQHQAASPLHNLVPVRARFGRLGSDRKGEGPSVG